MQAAVLREAPGRLDIEDVSPDKPRPREVVLPTAGAVARSVIVFH